MMILCIILYLREKQSNLSIHLFYHNFIVCTIYTIPLNCNICNSINILAMYTCIFVTYLYSIADTRLLRKQ